MCGSCGFQESITELEELVEDEKYQWALDTLQGILDNVIDFGHITDRQKIAVANIKGTR